MSILPQPNGRPVNWVQTTRKDSPSVSPELPSLTTPEDVKNCAETITTDTEYEARIQQNRVEAAKIGSREPQRTYDTEDSTCRPMPLAGYSTASSGKRKLDGTYSESLPPAKRLFRPGKTDREKRSETDDYDCLTNKNLQAECWSRSTGGSKDLVQHVMPHDTARVQIPASQKIVKESPISPTSPRAEPVDRYTPMSQKDLHRECFQRSLAIGYAKKDLRFRLRMYDAARALGLTPEESLEAQRATFQLFKRDPWSVNPFEFTEGARLGAVSKEAAEGQRLGNTPRMSALDGAPNYADMGGSELRSLCKARSLKQKGLRNSQLRHALKYYDRKKNREIENAGVAIDAAFPIAEPSDASASPATVPFLHLSSGSQDGEAPEQRARSLPVSLDVQEEARQQGSMERANKETSSNEDPHCSPHSPRLGLNANEEIDNGRTLRKTPDDTSPSPQQPLVSLLNLTIKEGGGDVSKSTHPKIQPKAILLSPYAMKVAEKEDFNDRYITETPFWICCCVTPDHEVAQKELEEFSGNCVYHVSKLAQRGSFTVGEYQEYQDTQKALDEIASCLCQKPAVSHTEHQVTMTEGGFILARIWREQWIRRRSLATFETDIAAYQQTGPLEVIHNILEDFMVVLSSRQQKRPFVLWARIEAMAWFASLLPTNKEWHSFQKRTRLRYYIMLFGIALLTTIDALLQQNLFKDKESKVPNLGLVLALFIKATWDLPPCTWRLLHEKESYKSPFNNDICTKNENGWAAEVISLADQHGVCISGVQSVDFIVDQWRKRKEFIESIRDRARAKRYAFLYGGKALPPSESTLVSIAAKEGEASAETGTERRITWKPEDDYDDNGQRLWKKWFYVREFEAYTKPYDVVDDSSGRDTG